MIEGEAMAQYVVVSDLDHCAPAIWMDVVPALYLYACNKDAVSDLFVCFCN